MAGALFIAGMLILIGFIGNLLFKRTHVPESLFLIVAGFFLGPILGLMNPSQLLGVAEIFTTFALIIVLMEGGINLDIFGVVKSLGKSFLFTFLSATLSLTFVAGILKIAGYPTFVSLAFGLAVAGTTSITVLHMVGKIKLPKEIREMLVMESVITDVLLITAALILIQITSLSSLTIDSIVSTISSEISIAFLSGVIAFFIWAHFNAAVKKHKLLYISTLGLLLVLYDVTEYMGGNGPIAVLTFSILLGNMSRLGRKIRGKSIFSSIKESLIRELRSVEREFAFFIKTFFFVYIGMLAKMSVHHFVLSAAIVTVLYSSKVLASWVFGHFIKQFKGREYSIGMVIPRGFSSILITLMFSGSGIIPEEFVTVAVGVIFLSTLLSMFTRLAQK